MKTHEARINLLKDNGYQPSGILDIGAHTGTWAEMINHVFPNTPILMIEGNTDHTEVLTQKVESIRHSSPGSSVSMELLSNKEKEVIYHKTRLSGTTGNSIYKENTEHFSDDHLIKEERTAKTLDQLTENSTIKYDFIKLDVQGAEADVINGGTTTISNASYILIETQLIEYNENAPFSHEIIGLMSSLNFKIVDIFELHYLPSGRLNEVDILFKNNNAKNLTKPTTSSNVSIKYDICLNKESPRKLISQIIRKTFSKKYR